MNAPDHMLRRSENPCIAGRIQTWTPIRGHDSMPIGREGIALKALSGAIGLILVILIVLVLTGRL
ncbi:hypothetical protein EV216_1321 [Rhodovulum steppense]|uniref:Uncharacterized protein n=1 Tax=Rhodovulum steppense TaxID=540251 RepID=A0A4R1YJD1_9RHOB|nr:hypothetical protein EV216_1321 [Rhodovulum steppense]